MADETPPLGARGGTRRCNALFCILEPHEDDWHSDVTGHSWQAPTPEHEVIAHVYTWPDEE